MTNSATAPAGQSRAGQARAGEAKAGAGSAAAGSAAAGSAAAGSAAAGSAAENRAVDGRAAEARAGESRAAQPRALIVTIYGLYARESDGWLSVASLIRLMSELGVDEPSVRSSISRLKQRGLLVQRRLDGAAGYGLSDSGRDILAEGDRRIFGRPRARLAGGWLLAVFSVPEAERDRRHTLRSRLAWLGFGTVAAGIWIAPAHLAEETAEVLERYGLSGYVDLFRADYLAFGDVHEQAARWWDLDRLEQLYQAFLDLCEPAVTRWQARSGPVGPAAAAEAFADYATILTAWRRLPFLDPGLPRELLPADWHGERAARVFAGLRDRLAGPARAHVLAVTGQAPA
jgi:phenylacetic acid degradation operon negative regulatory protein